MVVGVLEAAGFFFPMYSLWYQDMRHRSRFSAPDHVTARQLSHRAPVPEPSAPSLRARSPLGRAAHACGTLLLKYADGTPRTAGLGIA